MRTSLGFGGVALLGLFGACAFDTGGVASGSASVGAESVSTAEDTTDGSSSASASGASASASGASAEDETGVTDPSATDASATDPTSATDPSATSDAETSASSANAEAGTTGEPMTHHLKPTDQLSCDQPLWCFDGVVWNEAPVPTYGQQCFTSPAAPPFELLSVHYEVADVAPEVNAFQIEVFSHGAGGPNQVIHFVQMTAADAAAGSHEHVFETPVQIDDAEFCVGFATPYQGYAGALGMAVDVGTNVGGVSYLRLEGTGQCNIAAWADVIDDINTTPSGNWCIDVQIRELP